jgi:hypothetical protein
MLKSSGINGIRSQSNIQLQNGGLEGVLELKLMGDRPIGVHADGAFFCGVRFEKSTFELLAERECSSRYGCSPSSWRLREVLWLVAEAVYRSELDHDT